MDSEDRKINIQKEKEIQDRDENTLKQNMRIDFGGSKILPAYSIPLEYLIYNQHNGRIMSLVKSDQIGDKTKKLDPSQPEGKQILEDYLWHSNPGKNKTTMTNIETNGQLKIGIITRDGIIIDGNRRAMCLSKLNIKEFLCVVLDVDYDDKPMEIQKLEARFQMGEDEKLDYNANEKYLKVAELHDGGISIDDIAREINESVPRVRNMIGIKEMMDQYLEHFNYDGVYVRLDKREEAFINIHTWLNKYKKNLDKGGDKSAFDYREEHLDQLQLVAFDYIRAVYEQTDEDINWEKIRANLAGKQDRDKHIFGNEKIWNSFIDEHLPKIQEIKDNEIDPKESLNSPNYLKILSSRDNDFAKKALPFMKENYTDAQKNLSRLQNRNRPSNSIKDAKNELKSIDEDGKNKINDQGYKDLLEIDEQITNIFNKSSLIKQFQRIKQLCKQIDLHTLENSKENKEELSDEIRAIRKEIKDIEKHIFELDKAI